MIHRRITTGPTMRATLANTSRMAVKLAAGLGRLVHDEGYIYIYIYKYTNVDAAFRMRNGGYTTSAEFRDSATSRALVVGSVVFV
jgi:hypothetical protein